MLIQKHSGQKFRAVFNKTWLKSENENEKDYASGYAFFKNLLAHNIQQEEFLNSVVHHLQRDWPLIKEVHNRPERLTALFNNNFNEPIHAKSQIQNFFKELTRLIPTLFETFQEEEVKDQLAAYLRTINFMNKEDNE